MLWFRLTDAAVLPSPALVTVTLALPAHAVVRAARVTVPLVALGPHPALLALAGPAHAGPVRASLHHAHLCNTHNHT